MRGLFLVSALVGASSTALGLEIGITPFECTEKALKYLGCRNGVQSECFPVLWSEAVAQCSTFLSLTTATSFFTASDVTTATVTATETSDATATETSTSTAETTITEVSITTTTETTATTEVTSYTTDDVASFVPRGVQISGCPDLASKGLASLPDARHSWVCSCLGVTPTTAVTLETTTAISTATQSVTSLTTSTTTTTAVTVLSATTTTTTTSTTTSDVVATSTTIVEVQTAEPS
ncbi:hypothetical protein QBC47DRAFT_394593 [Echria macrotheca]|uniref:Uncharacterized protein n=1 Tax=Echria macrotheca TaxID=438768 RepID=A0AAJ0B4L9_9PEZI|nr:hypothetical protein QBC47DRAFT_394593 [Echria macrotheca]